jgi:hypothetical protein
LAFLKNENYLLSERCHLLNGTGDNTMSKKLLNESTIRRFGGLAGIKPTIVSNFIQESEYLDAGIVAEEDELDALEDDSIEDAEIDDMDATADAEADMDDAIADAGEAEEDMTDAALDAEMDAEAEGEETAEAIVQGIVDSLQQLAALAGVDMDVETGDEEILDMDLEDDGIDLDVEETLEEMLNGILGEDSGEEEGRHYEDDEEADRKHLRALEKDIDYDDDHVDEGKDGKDWHKAGDHKGQMGAKDKTEDYTTKKGDKLKHSGKGRGEKKGDKAYVNEALVQEVMKRVKSRLRKLSTAKK